MTSSPEPQEDTDFATRYNLQQALNNLPYSGQVDPLPPRWDQGNDGVFMACVTDWLGHYAEVVAQVRLTALTNQNELYDLRNQRDAVRAFLGIHQEGTT